MKLRIVTPMRTVLDIDDAVSIRAEDESGAFGLLSGHVTFVTALPVSVITWVRENGQEEYAALRGGVLQVREENTVDISARDAVAGQSFSVLGKDVLERFRNEARSEELSKTAAAMLNIAVIRQLEKYLEAGRMGVSAATHRSHDGGAKPPDME
ncbi:MAG TPA: F0F1 ATP synthase subunit epsilon [Hyphomicrobiales bacterium]|nr:F0F1 ATP synthase subunit epsilon [Hyphomicrobiales bacterium]